ncbi:hypothetical protein FQN57_006869 [Myotisia sp. PD_48]|nr:hypothetical protein FQN57_006869 [Myotisia sp. PD_48]
MANSTSSMQGSCMVPFLQEELFPRTGGFVEGRFCNKIGDGVTCCLPCPQVDWRYSEGFIKQTEIANWIAVVIFILNALVLISFAVLPVKVTHRHYLNVCLIMGIMFMDLAFIVPLGVQPNRCFNEITPHDMRSELTCAFSSSLILFGGWAVIVWSFCRTLSLHLQICWNVVPGKKFFICTLIAGWAIPPVGLAVALIITGTSYRFGSICHINHENGLQDFWGPLMALAGASLVIHFITMIYCIQVYVKSMLDDNPITDNSSALPSYSGSMHTLTARQTYRRVKHVIKLQWRGIAVVLTVLANVIFFAIVFLSLDEAARKTPENLKKAGPWIFCLAGSKGDKNACTSLAADLGPNESSIMAVLILLALSGLWTVLFLGRASMLTGWVHLIQQKFLPKSEFVSWDARDNGTQSRTYEMLNGSRQRSMNKSPDPLLTDARKSDMSTSTMNYSAFKADGYLGTEEVKYLNPQNSFSRPRPPSAQRADSSRGWNPESTFAPSGKETPTSQTTTPWYGVATSPRSP